MALGDRLAGTLLTVRRSAWAGPARRRSSSASATGCGPARRRSSTACARGIAVELLSGDRPEVVGQVARELGIETWRASAMPADKTAHLEALKGRGRHVLMVGDGLNDAPALAAATVSASPADIGQTAADAVFQGERLGAVIELLQVARGADRLVRQNLSLSIGYNALAVPIALFGMVTPLIAAIAMSSSSLMVVGNALRLSGRRR